MIVTTKEGKKVNLSKGIDLSIPLSNDDKNPLAWYVKPPQFTPVMEDGWVGSIFFLILMDMEHIQNV
mgnify:CR=1 FL=1